MDNHSISSTPNPTDHRFSRRVLIAEDDERTRDNLKNLLEQQDGLTVSTAKDGRQALELLADNEKQFSLFLTDVRMPGLDGLEIIEQIKNRQLPVTVVVMTAFGSIEEAVRAIRMGAVDFLTKPIDPDHLQLVVNRALRERGLLDEVLSLREQLQKRYAFHNIISKSPRMHSIFELINNVAHTTTTVLIEGSTGTGKEMVAKALHQASSRHRSGPFVAVNCAALPENLLESELFGHEKGAFTGAIGQRRGRFEMAHRGTLLLDEIGEISPAIQAKLLRVLQERRFERVGGAQTIEVDVRLVAATNKKLSRLVKAGDFREDLYYRVNVVRMSLPRLRDRPEDIPLLAAHFAQKYALPNKPPKTFSPEAMEVLMNHRWPGNVRELENIVERACVICQQETIGEKYLPPELTSPSHGQNPFRVDISRPLPDLIGDATATIEKEYIQKALKKTHGNVSKCAQIAGISRRSLTSKIADYDIDRKKLTDD